MMSTFRSIEQFKPGARPAMQLDDLLNRSVTVQKERWWISSLDLIFLAIVLAVLVVVIGVEVSNDARSELPAVTTLNAAKVQAPVEDNDSSLNMEKRLKFEHLASEIDAQAIGEQIQVILKGESVLLNFSSGVLFSENRVSLSRSGKAVLKKLVTLFQLAPFQIRIFGYNDPKEFLSKEFNSKQELTEERAIDVLDYLAINGIKDANMAVEKYRDEPGPFSNRVSLLLTLK